jgi:hypothetical protein
LALLPVHFLYDGSFSLSLFLTMAFKSKSPQKPMRRTAFKAKHTEASPLDQIKAQKKALQKATLRSLEKTKSDAREAGLDLSEWETDFIEGVTERVKTYGRSFADPDKGAVNGTLSLRQGLKLKEIRKKVKTKVSKS